MCSKRKWRVTTGVCFKVYWGKVFQVAVSMSDGAHNIAPHSVKFWHKIIRFVAQTYSGGL